MVHNKLRGYCNRCELLGLNDVMGSYNLNYVDIACKRGATNQRSEQYDVDLQNSDWHGGSSCVS